MLLLPLAAVRLLPRERWRPAALAADADADDDVISDEADLAGQEEEAGDATVRGQAHARGIDEAG